MDEIKERTPISPDQAHSEALQDDHDPLDEFEMSVSFILLAVLG